MDNCLFRVLSHKNILDEGYKYPALRLTGYGSYQNSFSEMARGYKKAADILAATQTDRGANSDDSLLFPIMFSSRQAAELRLKAILMNCVTPFNRSRTLGERGKEAAMIKTHSLSSTKTIFYFALQLAQQILTRCVFGSLTHLIIKKGRNHLFALSIQGIRRVFLANPCLIIT